jgi:hypothetical protein
MAGHRKNRKSNSAIFVSLALIASTFVAVSPSHQETPAEASGVSDKVSLYLSAPFVQGSHVTGANSSSESFNSMTTGDFASNNCPSSSNVGSITFLNGCYVSVAGVWGGATTDSSTPTVGGTGTNFMATPFYNTGSERSITFDFGSEVKYVGFWWSGGNNGNIVRFLDASDRLVAELSTNDIVSVLNPAPGSYPGSATVTTHASGTHPVSYYYGNPRFFSSTTPTSASVSPGNEPGGAGNVNTSSAIFTYLNLFLSGNLGVTKMQVAGPGFEFDNVTISTVEQQVQGSMVLITEKTVPTITWSPTTNLSITGSPATPSALATSSVAGTISYSVVSQGGTNCTVNSSTGVISYTALGNCVVRASFTPTNSATSFSATKNVTFTITRATQTITWAPTTALDLSATPATPSSIATTSGDGTISYSVTNAGATGCTVNSSTGVITYSAEGNCVVRASASQTSTYLSATRDITFVISAPTPQAAPAPAPYAGPIAMRFDVSCVPADSAMIVTLTGERLNTVKSASVNGTNIPVSAATATSLKLSLPAMKAGTYDVTYVSDSGVLTHQASLRVCSSSAVQSEPGQFTAQRLFANYRGDSGPVIARDRAAITSFIRQYSGIATVRCVGSTSGVPAKRTDPALAQARAKNACDVVKRLVPNATISIETSTGKGIGQRFRSVTIFISGTN